MAGYDDLSPCVFFFLCLDLSLGHPCGRHPPFATATGRRHMAARPSTRVPRSRPPYSVLIFVFRGATRPRQSDHRFHFFLQPSDTDSGRKSWWPWRGCWLFSAYATSICAACPGNADATSRSPNGSCRRSGIARGPIMDIDDALHHVGTGRAYACLPACTASMLP